ncbi:MAG: sulfotransferase [Acidobacteria bacterium]|nr:sulfotransferase [Acidobacteriota bacterium]
MGGLSIDQLHADASALAGGLTDFGTDDYLAGLRALVEAAAASPHAGDALDRRVGGSATNALAGRLCSQAGWTARPECLQAPLAPQVVVIGLPRSGTTALHQLLGADPRFQWIPAWMANRPRPRPDRDTWDDDPTYRARMEAYRTNGPNILHDVAPTDPEECITVMQQSFVSMTWVSSQAVPAYHDWFIDTDERPSYLRYADNLRLIGADAGDAPWLLKNPSHTFGLAAMLETFPDARFVHIYRDPAASIVSGCSLIASMGIGEGTFTPEELGAHRLRIWSLAAERMDVARAGRPDRQFCDVDYRDFVADPLAAAHGIYKQLDLELTPAAEAAMRQWMDDRPKDKHGAHRYTAEEFGLSTGEIRERMAGYIDRYGIS